MSETYFEWRVALERAELEVEALKKKIAEEERQRASFSAVADLLRTRGGTRAWMLVSDVADHVVYSRGGHLGYGYCDTSEGRGFHWRGGIYFERLNTGEVVIADWRPIIDDDGKHHWTGQQVAVIPADEWASVVASVSVLGETSERYEQARAFHNVAAASPGAPTP